jgi:diacylglycerol kinase (ATP)
MPNEKRRGPRKGLAILLNPAAGGGRAAEKRAALVRLLDSRGVPFDLFVTESEAHLRTLTREKSRDYDVLAGAGGDSTFQIMAEEITQTGEPVRLGMIGLGSSNDIPLEFGVETPEKFVAALEEGRERRIDLGCVEHEGRRLKLFIGQASLGLGALVNEFAARVGRVRPRLASHQTAVGIWGVARAYRRKLVPVPLAVESEAGRTEGLFQVATFANTRFWATGRLFVPQTRPDDGRLDACLIRRCPFLRFARLAASVRTGRHLRAREVECLQSPVFTVSSQRPFALQVDGELIGGPDSPALFEKVLVRVVPAAINVIA